MQEPMSVGALDGDRHVVYSSEPGKWRRVWLDPGLCHNGSGTLDCATQCARLDGLTQMTCGS